MMVSVFLFGLDFMFFNWIIFLDSSNSDLDGSNKVDKSLSDDEWDEDEDEEESDMEVDA